MNCTFGRNSTLHPSKEIWMLLFWNSVQHNAWFVKINDVSFLFYRWQVQWQIQDFPEMGTMADPGFSRRGRWSTPESGEQTYYLARFLPKTAWKWRNWDGGGRGGASLSFLGSANGYANHRRGTQPAITYLPTKFWKVIFQSCVSVCHGGAIQSIQGPSPPHPMYRAFETGPPSLSPRDMLKLVRFGPHFTWTAGIIQQYFSTSEAPETSNC